MHVKTISLKDFRNFSKLELELSSQINILYGDNAQGKTNFLESIYMCATGRSQRSKNDKELIMFGSDSAHVKAVVVESGASDKIDVHIKKDFKKGIAINGVPIKKSGQLFGILLAVVFSPEDLQLLKAGPAERRRFLDVELCQLSAVYYYELQQYYHVLKQRNNLLKSLNNNRELFDTLSVWNEQLLVHGIKIIKYRAEFVRDMNEAVAELHSNITSNKEKLSLVYKPNVLADDFHDKLNKSASRDILTGSTNVGIHKDDLVFYINNTDGRVYGSQGQQRTACLSVKLAEIKLIERQKGKSPILLLDDVLSELDEHRQKFILNIALGVQTLITCTGIDSIVKSSLAQGESFVFNVRGGIIKR